MHNNLPKPKIYSTPLEINEKHSFFNLVNFVEQQSVLLKLEGLNPAGSIKIKPALKMIEELERKGLINPTENTIIESSSGNLGIALSIICKVKGYKFMCISDPNINKKSAKYIELYGGQLTIIHNRDENNGYLNSRIRYIKQLLEENSNYIWLNQYANQHNMNAHSEETAAEIFNSLENIDYLFVGVGTSGTIMGCYNYIKKNNLQTKLIAIDAEGSVSFGHPPAKRLIPGIGTSRKPELLENEIFDEIIIVPESETIKTCYKVLNEHSLLIGGSTGSVLAGVTQYKNKLKHDAKIVAISPDFGDKYLDTIYDHDWINNHFNNIKI